MDALKKYRAPLLLWMVFAAIAVGLWQGLHNPFYLANFLYIGTALAVGLALAVRKHPHFRQVTQFAVGTYMLVFLGFLGHENMQIEGFWYYLLLGVFEGATIHYLVAKVAGPALFGRGWCGYACWTAMALDLLPYKTPLRKRKKHLGAVRYFVFASSFALVASLMLFYTGDMERFMWLSFLAGNAAYYALGVTLAFALKDNRAFCKYLCPVSVIMKPAAYVSLLRVKCDETACIGCGRCQKACPMDVNMTDNSRNRENGTECILCMACIDACPVHALKL